MLEPDLHQYHGASNKFRSKLLCALRELKICYSSLFCYQFR